jgi:hypothetical protein
MPTPFSFNLLSQQAKLSVIVFSIFLVSLSIGMLVFGTHNEVSDMLNAELLQHGAETIHLTPTP